MIAGATTALPPAEPTPRPAPAPTTAPARARWLRYAAYPALMLLCALLCAHAIGAGLDLQGLVPLIFLGIFVTLVVLERLIPFREDWQTTRGEAVRDTVYAGQGVIFGGLGQAVAGVAAVAYAGGDNGLPLWLAAPLAIVLTDLCTYGFHRFVHANRFMWREHGIHHVPDKVNTLDANTAHFLDILLNNVAAYAPVLALGFGPEAIFIATVARGLQTFAIHANVDVRLGGLGHVLMGPEHHRLHHSARADEAGNYATILTLWDRVFGTFTWAPGRGVERVGVADPGSFPAPHRILASAVHPLRWWLGSRGDARPLGARGRSLSPPAGR